MLSVSNPFMLKEAFGESLHGKCIPLWTGVFLRPATTAGNKLFSRHPAGPMLCLTLTTPLSYFL